MKKTGSVEEISKQNTTASNHFVDCTDCKQLLENTKRLIQSQPKRKQIPLLTLASDSWTQQKAALYFNVKLYSIRKAALLKKEQVLTKVPRKKGHQLDDDVINLVKQFYEDNEYSRMLGQRSINLRQLMVLKGRNKRGYFW